MTTWWKKTSEKKEPDRVWWEPPKITPRLPETDETNADEFKAALDKLREAVKAYYG